MPGTRQWAQQKQSASFLPCLIKNRRVANLQIQLTACSRSSPKERLLMVIEKSTVIWWMANQSNVSFLAKLYSSMWSYWLELHIPRVTTHAHCFRACSSHNQFVTGFVHPWAYSPRLSCHTWLHGSNRHNDDLFLEWVSVSTGVRKPGNTCAPPTARIWS